jgi:hypothetical protein
MQLAPMVGSGDSPGGAGWGSFAKLLAWCPGCDQFESAKTQRLIVSVETGWSVSKVICIGLTRQ